MLAEILTAAASWTSERCLLTYIVPAELEDVLAAGQLVAIPYGDRLVEGIVWTISTMSASDERSDEEQSYELRPISGVLDVEPALLPHQRALAEWMATYYVTPLAQVALMMLPSGLIQRSKAVLHLSSIQGNEQENEISLQVQALLGLLRADGELDIERLKEMLGPTKAKAILKEALASGLIAREAQLEAPKAKKRIKRVVQLSAKPDMLAVWRQRTEAIVQQSLEQREPVPMAPDTVRKRPQKVQVNPWASAGTAVIAPGDRAGLLAQRQLAALDLVQRSARSEQGDTYWTPNKLCQATKLTSAQLQALVKEDLLAIEAVEVQRNPFAGRTFPPNTPLPLTTDQQCALEVILSSSAEKPILLHGITGSGKTEVYLQALAAIIAQGKRAIVLVPEIVLTTQAIQRFAGRFPGRVAIIHGDLFIGERYDEWRRIRAGQVDIVIGARSALFSPLPDLGMIILDEEHESAYKQTGL
ncbi:MAG: DEAD/DEAH box helicase, partial [Chloroflexota bacterium]|nr:DEAD/DEAH box helicase [Chloroflexota bacterium]